MTATDLPGAGIPIATVPNLRDLGGWPTTDGGTVRRGLVFRSADFADLSGPALDAFEALGIRSVYDLRTADERTAEPNTVPDGVAYVVADVLQGSADAAPAQLLAVLADPAAAESRLGGGRSITLFEGAYREIVGLPSALVAYRRFFTDLADESTRPTLFHCTTGKDRTGWCAAALLLLLGVAEDDVRADYLLTNDQLLPALQPVFDDFAAAGGDPELLRPVLGVRGEYLDAALDEMRSRFGTVGGYFTDGLGLDADTVDAIRTAFVERG